MAGHKKISKFVCRKFYPECSALIIKNVICISRVYNYGKKELNNYGKELKVRIFRMNFPTFFQMGGNFSDFLFASLHIMPLLKMGLL